MGLRAIAKNPLKPRKIQAISKLTVNFFDKVFVRNFLSF